MADERYVVCGLSVNSRIVMRTKIMSSGVLIVVLMLALKAFAGEIVVIPNIAMTEVSGSLVSTNPNQSVLVQSGGNAVLNSNGNTIVVEKGGSAVITGDKQKVYLYRGGGLVITGTENTVYYENNSELVASGSDSRVIQVDGFSLK